MRFGVVPSSVRRDVLAWHGADGQAWLDELPRTVWALARKWSLKLDVPAFAGGSQAYVVAARREDGSDAVLKVPYVDDENRAEATALRAYDGDGAVRLYDYDPSTGGILMERLVPGNRLKSTRFFGHRTPEAAWRRIGIACGLYRRLWRPVESFEGLPEIPNAADLVEAWIAAYRTAGPETLYRAGEETLRLGVELGEELLRETPELGLANRDTHLTNIVSAEREPWLLIDPKPCVAERAFDGGYFLFKQQVHGPHSGTDLLQAVAEGLGADAGRVRSWAMLRCVDQIVGADSDQERHLALKALDDLQRA
ncbi:aminoglycoside phosphotransferase family protein [Glycomyces sp. NPDC046736]|uniref:aminoglycoside phosphotransferase family protein n=1 Tax=Glycomyces sp. NPDC046736 TaxID=3155615 RepID=UPI0033DCC6BB